MKKLSFVLALVLPMFLIQSCQKNAEVDTFANQEAPQLPSEETFVITTKPFTELSGFTSVEAQSRGIDNWGHSVANVVVWNTLLNIHLAIPTLSFYESFKHQPVYQGEGIWLWAYEVTDKGATYQAELYGEILNDDEVKWDMYISKVGGFSQVHWYSGITAKDESYASWTLNFNPNNPTPFVRIDYKRNDGNGIASIRYTNIIPEVAEKGSYIEYQVGEDASGQFDRAYNVYKAEIDNLLEINWNSDTKVGRVKDAEKFQDEEWHCWGTNIQDIDC